MWTENTWTLRQTLAYKNIKGTVNQSTKNTRRMSGVLKYMWLFFTSPAMNDAFASHLKSNTGNEQQLTWKWVEKNVDQDANNKTGTLGNMTNLLTCYKQMTRLHLHWKHVNMNCNLIVGAYQQKIPKPGRGSKTDALGNMTDSFYAPGNEWCCCVWTE